jgi:hypothetical protein
MSRNPYDQASRYAAKMDPAGFLCWLLRVMALPLPFRGWLDTRTLPFPGEPDRICDTVAWLGQAAALSWAVVVEFCYEPDERMFGRLLTYLGRLWLERRPDGAQSSRFHVGAVVVNLTGQGSTSGDMQLQGTGLRTLLHVEERNLADEDATATLDGVASGALAWSVLPWIPLMRGGADSGILQRWKELAAAEPDPRRRSDYGGLALVFAEAAGRRVAWHDALKEWNMTESQQVLEWIAEGEAKGERKNKVAYLLRVLQRKFPPGPPPELVSIIQSTTDSTLLTRWFDAAFDAQSLDDFRRAMTA